MKKVVITGITSMIGVAITEALLQHDIEVIYAVIRPGTAKLSRLPLDERIVLVECDMENYSELPKKIKEKCDVFYHIAWGATGVKRNSNIVAQGANIQYALQAIRAAYDLGCKKFIGAGSQAEFGVLDIEKISPDSPVDPIQPYGIAKYAAGKLVRAEAERLGMDCLWVRIFSVFGKYDKETSMIASSLRKMLNGEDTLFTRAEQKWDYLYSADAGQAFYLIGEKSVGNKVYCLGSGEARPLYEYIRIMQDIVKPQSQVKIGAIPYPANAVMNLCADISALQRDTGFVPMVKFEDGIKQYLLYF